MTRSNTGGFTPRFDIARTDGSPIDPARRYMVLSFDGSDPEAAEALLFYAGLKEQKNPGLAADIRAAIADPPSAPAQHRWAK